MARSQYWTSKGNKRLLKRNKKGQIVDNQSYKRVSQLDQKKKSVSEKEKRIRLLIQGKESDIKMLKKALKKLSK